MKSKLILPTSPQFYGIICHPYLRIFYMTFTGIMGAIGMVVPWVRLRSSSLN